MTHMSPYEYTESATAGAVGPWESLPSLYRDLYRDLYRVSTEISTESLPRSLPSLYRDLYRVFTEISTEHMLPSLYRDPGKYNNKLCRATKHRHDATATMDMHTGTGVHHNNKVKIAK